MTEDGRTGLLALIGPGILVAATGVGAGDLATAAFTGSLLGTAVLWAVIVGAVLKFALNEGIARWQLATGQTFLEGVIDKLGRPALWLFFPYLFLWTFFVASALMSACGVTAHAMVPLFDDPVHGKLVLGIVHSVAGAALVLAGGFSLFEKVMSVCIGVMFAVVVVTAILLWPGSDDVARGLWPSIPDLDWTVALMGGVGGTLTVLCYGYWIRERGRTGLESLRLCRVDLGIGYAMTAIFGMAMVIIGSTITVEGSGATLVITLADRLEGPLGPIGRWAFLIGAWGAVFSSLLGVWQAIPYLFADAWHTATARTRPAPVNAGDLTTSRAYRVYLAAITVVPMLGLGIGFKQVQKLYAVIGALVIPGIALALLILNSRRAWVGAARNRPVTIVLLSGALGFFGWILFEQAAG